MYESTRVKHLTHGSSVNFSGRIYNFVFYHLDDTGRIDYEDFRKQIIEHKPAVIVAGASAYSRIIDFKLMREIIKDCCEEYRLNYEATYKPYFMVDMAHIAGLIAAGDHPTPFGYADVITTTCHKTLRGPRGALIFCKLDLAKTIDGAVFPG